jgi:type IV secretory pathway VirB10-like protein
VTERTPKAPDPTLDLDTLPLVASRSSPWPLAFTCVGALAIGGVVFVQLSSGRMRIEADSSQISGALAQISSFEAYVPTRRVVYPEPPSEESADPDVVVDDFQEPASEAPQIPDADRLRAPVLVLDLSEASLTREDASNAPDADNRLNARAVTDAMSSSANAGALLSADERFASRFGAGDKSGGARATRLGDLSTTVIQGEVIPAVLETALNSDLPGYARATVTRDVRGFDGTRVLVPRGSRLIGQYRAGVALGQSRAFLIWTRLIRPDGATIDLAAPATDGLGRGGLAGDVDSHFFERFGGSMLLSLMSIGGNVVADSPDTSLVISSARSGVDPAGGASSAAIGPTVTVQQGAPVRVFVNQDLDFSAVGAVQTSAPPA